MTKTARLIVQCTAVLAAGVTVVLGSLAVPEPAGPRPVVPAGISAGRPPLSGAVTVIGGLR
jgi:hypothetical protein